jgi:hypothetical protein
VFHDDTQRSKLRVLYVCARPSFPPRKRRKGKGRKGKGKEERPTELVDRSPMGLTRLVASFVFFFASNSFCLAWTFPSLASPNTEGASGADWL